MPQRKKIPPPKGRHINNLDYFTADENQSQRLNWYSIPKRSERGS